MFKRLLAVLLTVLLVNTAYALNREDTSPTAYTGTISATGTNQSYWGIDMDATPMYLYNDGTGIKVTSNSTEATLAPLTASVGTFDSVTSKGDINMNALGAADSDSGIFTIKTNGGTTPPGTTPQNWTIKGYHHATAPYLDINGPTGGYIDIDKAVNSSVGFNGTIGATTPAAGSFTTVNVSGSITFNGGTYLKSSTNSLNFGTVLGNIITSTSGGIVTVAAGTINGMSSGGANHLTLATTNAAYDVKIDSANDIYLDLGASTDTMYFRQGTTNIATLTGTGVYNIPQVQSSFQRKYTNQTSATLTLDATHEHVNVDSTSNTVAITLPDANTYISAGYTKTYRIYVGTYVSAVTLVTDGTDTFDGTNKTITLNAVDSQVTVTSVSASKWSIDSSNNITVSP